MQSLKKRYGDMVHVKLLDKHYYLVNHPQQIEQVLMAGYKVKRSIPLPMQRALGKGLICSADEHHRRARALILPFFQKQSPQFMAETILDCVRHQMSAWSDGEERDIEAEMIHLTLRIILKVVFGTDFGNAIEKIAGASAKVHENGNATPRAVFNTLLLRLPVAGKYTPLGRARDYLDDAIYQLIRTRRNQKDIEGSDLVSMLLRLQLQGDALTRPFVTDKFIRDEAITMLTAGHETISSALTWAWYLLAKHPESEARLHEEVAAVLNDNRQPGLEDLPKFRYIRMVLSESMRLYPPVWAAARCVLEPLEIGGFQIPKRSRIYFTQYLVHRDARFHPNPDGFNPERFLPGEQAKRPNCSYFPFGAGNRQCIGEGFAWMEGLLLIASVSQQWRLLLVDDHPVETEPLIALQPKFGMRMRLQKRQQAPAAAEAAMENYAASL